MVSEDVTRVSLAVVDAVRLRAAGMPLPENTWAEVLAATVVRRYLMDRLAERVRHDR